MADAPRKARLRKAVGPDRPRYLTGADTDKMMAIVLALMSEVASLRERVDAHERLGTEGKLPAFELVERFEPDEPTEAERAAWRKAYIRRLFRVVTEQVEQATHRAAPQDGAMAPNQGYSE